MGAQAATVISPLPLVQLLAFGCVGSLLVEAIKHVRKLQGRQLPDMFDIVVSVILIAIGGGVAMIYMGQVQSIPMAVQIGASAPSIIGAWASGGQQPPGGGTTTMQKLDILSQVGRALSWRL